MTETFAIEMLPANEGDCLVISYGDASKPRRVMIDAGRKGSYRSIRPRLTGGSDPPSTFELLIVSHVDRDHVEGVLQMLGDPSRPLAFRDVWFNGYHHLRDSSIEAFGPRQGEQLSALLRAPGATWNAAFEGRSVEVAADQGPIVLEGGLTLTLLGPDRASLAAFIPDWEKECRRAGIVAGARLPREAVPPGYEVFGEQSIDDLADSRFEDDSSPANATSIVVLAEYGERKALLAADVPEALLTAALRPLADAGGTVHLDAVKVPHHGSRYNVSRDLVELLNCPRFLISTNGSYFEHPHDEAVARIVKFGRDPELVFNYRSPQTDKWDDDRRRAEGRYQTKYPAQGHNGTVAIELL